MGFEYARIWAVHNTTTIQMEGGKNYSNSTHPIWKCGARGFLVILV
jgi:hypothetical protein